MSKHRGYALAAGFFVVYFLAISWPGIIPFNRIRPLIFGLPFSMAWVTGWVIAGGLVLWWLERREDR